MTEKPRIRQVIVVEGKYDAIRVRSAVDAIVVETGGFRLFREPEKRELLRRYAAQRGLIILTDSDSAGAVIRNHLLSFLPPEQVTLAYIPPIPGKEKRKTAPSCEGLLGVEGMDTATILVALERAGVLPSDGDAPAHGRIMLTKADLYTLGLSGCGDSAARRQSLLAALGLPRHLSANRLLEVLNATVSREELQQLLERLK